MSLIRRDSNSLVSSAGWLYADLLLALTIIGFSAVVATNHTDPPPTTTTVAQSTTVPKEKLSTNLNCNEFAIRLDSEANQSAVDQIVDSQVREAISNENFPLDETQVGIVIMYGGYGSGETVTDGKNYAISFKPKIRNTSWMRNSELVLGGANQIEIGSNRVAVGPREILLKVYLVYRGDPNSSGCS